MFRRTRYQRGSLRLEERKRGSAVWVYRWWENDITGKPIRRKVQLGCLEQYPNESAACAAADALRLTINNQSKRKNLQKTTVNALCRLFSRMPFAGSSVATIRFHREYPLEPGGREGQARACASVRSVRKSPLVLSPEEVKLGLAELEFRDQILVFLDGALGIRQGELGALRWLDCNFDNMNFSVHHSYYWHRGGHLKSTKTEASAKLLPMHASLKHALLEWRSQSLYNQPTDFVFPFERLKGSKPLDLASVLKKKIQPAFRKIGIQGVGWHTFRHAVGSMLAEMGEHQLMIRDYLRHANLHVTNKYLQATTTSKRLAQGKLVDAILPGGVLSVNKSTLVH